MTHSVLDLWILGGGISLDREMRRDGAKKMPLNEENILLLGNSSLGTEILKNAFATGHETCFEMPLHKKKCIKTNSICPPFSVSMTVRETEALES